MRHVGWALSGFSFCTLRACKSNRPAILSSLSDRFPTRCADSLKEEHQIARCWDYADLKKTRFPQWSRVATKISLCGPQSPTNQDSGGSCGLSSENMRIICALHSCVFKSFVLWSDNARMLPNSIRIDFSMRRLAFPSMEHFNSHIVRTCVWIKCNSLLNHLIIHLIWCEMLIHSF